MARYLVIEFTDNKEAEAFKEKVDKLTQERRTLRVVGMFALPRIYACQCNLTSPGKYKHPKPERGERFGWWVCGTCNKPRPGGHQLINLLTPGNLFGKKARKHITEPKNPRDFEWQIKGLSIAEVPLQNIGRKKKRFI